MLEFLSPFDFTNFFLAGKVIQLLLNIILNLIQDKYEHNFQKILFTKWFINLFVAYLLVWAVSFCHRFSCPLCPQILEASLPGIRWSWKVDKVGMWEIEENCVVTFFKTWIHTKVQNLFWSHIYILFSISTMLFLKTFMDFYKFIFIEKTPQFSLKFIRADKVLN